MAQDLAKSGVGLPALMTAGRWKNSRTPARYTERQTVDRGAVARYYQEQENFQNRLDSTVKGRKVGKRYPALFWAVSSVGRAPDF